MKLFIKVPLYALAAYGLFNAGLQAYIGLKIADEVRDLPAQEVIRRYHDWLAQALK